MRWQVTRIAATIGVTRETIRLDILAVEAEWRSALKSDTEKLKAAMNAELDLASANYWQGWQSSLNPTTTKSTKSIGTPGSESAKGRKNLIAEIQNKTVTTSGDPRFLDGVVRCIEKRAALFGLDKVDEANGEAAHAFAEKVRMDMRAAEAATLNIDGTANDAPMDEDT